MQFEISNNIDFSGEKYIYSTIADLKNNVVTLEQSNTNWADFQAILSKITIIGGVFLVILSGLPIIFSALSELPANVTIGGTSLLIVVGVALETYKQLEGSLVSRNYKKGYSRR